MKDFRFRLQPVLDLREQREREAAAELSAAQLEATRARSAHDAMTQAVRDGRAQSALLVGDDSRLVGEMQLCARVVQQLDQRALDTAREVHAAAKVVDRSLTAYSHAAIDRNMLDRLEERHRSVWRQAELAEEQKAMDSLALSRFTSQSALED